ncbi:MAG: methyltransferase [Polyangiales bacterium]
MEHPPLEAVESAIHRLFIRVEGVTLRAEDRKKAKELHGLLPHLSPVSRRHVVVDAAAGRASVGLVASELLSPCDLVVIERAPDRARACRDAAAHLTRGGAVDVRESDVAELSAWPEEPELVVALHACGPASDHVIDRAAARGARRILLVPCCVGAGVSFAATAREAVSRWPVPRQSAVRQRLEHGLIDAWRTLRLEAAGYEVTVLPFVPPTVTPYNLLWRCRRVGQRASMERAARRLEEILSLGGGTPR